MIILCTFLIYKLFIRRNIQENSEKIKHQNNLNVCPANNKYDGIYDNPIYETPIYDELESTEEGNLINVEYVEIFSINKNEPEYLDMTVSNLNNKCL